MPAHRERMHTSPEVWLLPHPPGLDVDALRFLELTRQWPFPNCLCLSQPEAHTQLNRNDKGESTGLIVEAPTGCQNDSGGA